MKCIKIFGLSTFAAVAAMALMGTSAAMAEGTTALCKVNEKTCSEGNLVNKLHTTLAAGTTWSINGTSPNTDVLCLSVLELADTVLTIPLGGGFSHAERHRTQLAFSGCGVIGTGSHTNCTVTATELPTLIATLRNEPGQFFDVRLNGKFLVKCVVFGFIKTECEYDEEELVLEAEGANGALNGMFNAAGTQLEKSSGGSLCPETSEISEGLLEPLEAVYLTE